MPRSVSKSYLSGSIARKVPKSAPKVNFQQETGLKFAITPPQCAVRFVVAAPNLSSTRNVTASAQETSRAEYVPSREQIYHPRLEGRLEHAESLLLSQWIFSRVHTLHCTAT